MKEDTEIEIVKTEEQELHEKEEDFNTEPIIQQSVYQGLVDLNTRFNDYIKESKKDHCRVWIAIICIITSLIILLIISKYS
jgi:hypothetical protein